MSELKKTIKNMKSLARMLVPHTYPKVTFEEEQDVAILKQRTMTVDGHEVVLCYSEALYPDYRLKSLQVQSVHAPFLPFVIVCKIGKLFLGTNNLSYIEFFRNNRKVYCWTIKTRNGRLLPPGKKTKPGNYEGFEFRILHPGSVDLF